MADWSLVPCLVKLRSEFNGIAPNRDRESDGSKGDAAHAARDSDHNPDRRGLVHAIDVDVDLRQPGLVMEDVVQFLVDRCRRGLERRLTYIISNRRIWSAAYSWRERSYSGSNAHDKHTHFSASDAPALEASTASWHLEDLVALTDDDIKRIWAYNIGSATGTASQSAQGALVTANVRAGGIANTQLPALAVRVAELAGKDFVDEAAIVKAVLAGFDPKALAAAVAEALPREQARQVADELAQRLAA
ncbi:hypothetical protein [Paractinoplanes atraurantiacus]|uniref:Uncharacterized protein n=1 Tax=Paractinoplanes atraurantiacus TaxID=1036182 RepID=A0A285GZZ1_9ACTN|nr:hypothetical protein [Actinoplanes atraurantiacus]SNY29092.1 hypothetical protein SAMN05421748_103190 [Actinoplanes atraurantiacus]